MGWAYTKEKFCLNCGEKLKHYQRKFCSRKCAEIYKRGFVGENRMKVSEFKSMMEAVWNSGKMDKKGRIRNGRKSYFKFRGGRNFSCPNCGGISPDNRDVYNKVCPICGAEMLNVTAATLRKR